MQYAHLRAVGPKLLGDGLGGSRRTRRLVYRKEDLHRVNLP
jgi:hypothetical protein